MSDLIYTPNSTMQQLSARIAAAVEPILSDHPGQVHVVILLTDKENVGSMANGDHAVLRALAAQFVAKYDRGEISK